MDSKDPFCELPSGPLNKELWAAYKADSGPSRQLERKWGPESYSTRKGILPKLVNLEEDPEPR